MTTDPLGSRLYFLDWLRIIAFFLLILYHTGMYYVSWDWHVKSPHAGPAIEPLMLLLSPWRMSLLFLISGVASGFLLTKAPGGFLRERTRRLLPPLLFGTLLKPVHLPPVTEGAVLVVLTCVFSFGIFEAVRRVALLRPLFGLAGAGADTGLSGENPRVGIPSTFG